MDIFREMWLHTLCDFEPERVALLSTAIENEGSALHSVEKEIEKLKRAGISADIAERLGESEYYNCAKDILNYCEQNNIRIITQDSEEYPSYLMNVELKPRILFAKGKQLSLNNSLNVAVVGCRKPTPHGKEIARQIGYNLAENGITVVSGMAEGIDAEAHIGAIRAGGTTVAVLAGSVDSIYPKSNTKLYYEILKNGTIISERPPRSVVQKYFYRQRNRIVVGVSRGVVVVEGAFLSGTSMTAEIATENNRDIFAVPGNPLIKQSELPNQLIFDGAAIVNSVGAVTEYYKGCLPELINKKTNIIKEQKRVNLKPVEQQIVEFILGNGGIAMVEEIAEACNISTAILNSHLTILVIKGILNQESGNRYIVKKTE